MPKLGYTPKCALSEIESEGIFMFQTSRMKMQLMVKLTEAHAVALYYALNDCNVLKRLQYTTAHMVAVSSLYLYG